MGTCRNLWKANVSSDGRFVEISVTYANAWYSVEPTKTRSQCDGLRFGGSCFSQQSLYI